MARNRVLGILVVAVVALATGFLYRREICDFPAVLLATIGWRLDWARRVTAGVNPA
jgi:hypothetical protein